LNWSKAIETKLKKSWKISATTCLTFCKNNSSLTLEPLTPRCSIWRWRETISVTWENSCLENKERELFKKPRTPTKMPTVKLKIWSLLTPSDWA
jgi:hypothetical protein